MNNNYECPFCLGRKSEIVNQIKSEQSAAHFVLPWIDRGRHLELKNKIEALWGRAECHVIRCSFCAGQFAWPFISGDKLFYDLAFPTHRYPQNKWEYGAALAWLKETFNDFSGMCVLEIGAGDGSFIRKLIHYGFNPGNIGAFEYNECNREKIDILKIRFASSDYFMSSKLMGNGEDKYHLVALFQVLEHLDNLAAFLDFISARLSPGGHLLFAIPNHNFIDFNEKHGQIIDMPPDHISRFSEKSLQVLASKHNFKIVAFQVEPSRTLNAVKIFFYYRYLKNAQTGRSLAGHISRSSNSTLKRLLIVFYMCLIMLFNLKLLSSLLKLGPVYFVVFKKNGAGCDLNAYLVK